MSKSERRVVPIQFQERMVSEIEDYLDEGLYSSKAEFVREAVRDKLMELRKKLFWKRTEEIKKELKKRGISIKTPFLTREQKEEVIKEMKNKLKAQKDHEP